MQKKILILSTRCALTRCGAWLDDYGSARDFDAMIEGLNMI